MALPLINLNLGEDLRIKNPHVAFFEDQPSGSRNADYHLHSEQQD